METEGLGRQDCILGETVWGSERVLALKVSTPDQGSPEDVQFSQRLKQRNHHHHHHPFERGRTLASSGKKDHMGLAWWRSG